MNTRASNPYHRLSAIVSATLCVAIAASSLLKIFDPDIWWHIRTGEWIWTHLSVPTADPFSYTSEGPLSYTESLAQLFFFGLHSVGGALAIGIAVAILCGLLAFLVLSTARQAVGDPPSVVAVAMTLLMWVLAAHFRLGPKTEIFSFIGFALVLHLLLETERRKQPRLLLWIPPMLILWGNLHRGGSVVLGMLVLAVFFWALRPATRPLVKVALPVALFAPPALMLNSGGVSYLTASFDLMSRSSFRGLLPEWSHASWSSLIHEDPIFLAMMVLWLVSWLRRRRFNLELGLALMTCVLALSSIRLIPLAATALVPGIARMLAHDGQKLATRVDPILRQPTRQVAAALVFIAVLGWHYQATYPLSMWGVGILKWRVPVAAAQFLEQHPPRGAMWNDFIFGGYLLYALAPEQKVFIDGRNDTVYSDDHFAETVRATYDPFAMAAQLKRWDIGYAVLQLEKTSTERHLSLYRDPRWQLVYLDDLVAVLVDRTIQETAYLERHAYQELRPDTAVHRALNLSNTPEDRVLGAEIVRYAIEQPDSLRAQILLSLLQRARGEITAYRKRIRLIQTIAHSRNIRNLQFPAME